MKNKHLESPEVDELFDAILALKDRSECYSFFEDLSTIQELKSLALRLQVAKRLYFHDDTYNTITKDFGVSAVTISRVKNCLMYGSGGYKLILDRIGDKSEDSEQNK